MSQGTEPILLADIGGTNARFALLESERLRAVASLPVAAHPSTLAAIRAYLAGDGRGVALRRAAIAAAGPVEDGRVSLTNAGWSIDGSALREALGLGALTVVNDFTALAWSLPGLAASDLCAIGGGRALAGAPLAVIGPGTGFGVAALLRVGGREIALATEGGHATLSAEDRREDEIIQSLRESLGHVSVERLLSGDGLARLHAAAAAREGLPAPTLAAAEIVERAVAGTCMACRATLDLFCALLGSVAGNIALTLGARGGIYIAGGIVPRFADHLARSPFRARFEAKGRMSDYLRAIPTSIVRHPHPALLGLARLVRRSEGGADAP
jgi:glucokinase